MPSRKTLTLAQKVEAIHKYEKGGKSQQAIADEYGVGKTQISNIMKRKREYLDDYEANGPCTKKRATRKTGNEEINQLCWEWFCDRTSRQAPVSGPLLKEQALVFAEQLCITTFKASTGWLDSFKKRHQISGASMVGESGSVDKGLVEDWTQKLPNLIAGYAPEDVYNLDKTGLFYKQTTNKTLHVKGEQCSGGKQSKERIAVMLCASMAGGKFPNPHCFRNIKRQYLPATYTNQHKAWMNSAIFLDWLKKFDRKMGRLCRKVLLFLDNAPCHPKVTLRNVELRFFPANTTSCLQPMDKGVIQAVKLKYRKKQLRKVLQQMEEHPDVSCVALAKRTTVLDAIRYLGSAWKDTEATTITKCFKNAGFPVTSETVPDSTQQPEETPELDHISNEIYGCDLQDVPAVDQNLATYDTHTRDWSKSATELLNTEQTDAVSSEDEEEEQIQPRSSVKSLNKAIEMARDLQLFCNEQGLEEAVVHSDALDEALMNAWYYKKTSARQTKMSDFFLPVSK